MSTTERLYRRLVRLYPPGMRRHESEMWAVIERRQARLAAENKRWRIARLWAFILRDLLRTLPAAYLAAWRNTDPKRTAPSTQRTTAHREGPVGGRGVDGGSWGTRLGDFRHDMTIAVRSLAQSPRFTVTAVVILGLGIGANTAIFSVLDAVYFNDAPHVTAPQDLVRLYGESRAATAGPLTHPDFAHFRAEHEVFSDLAGYASEGAALTITRLGTRDSGTAQFVSDNYFDVLGMRPDRGRWFQPEEDEAGGSHLVAVISHGLWSRIFDSSASAIGQIIQLNGHAFTVVGVTPEGFRGLSPLEATADVWLPLRARWVLTPNDRFSIWTRQERTVMWIVGVGRLREGVTVEAAQNNIDAMSLHLKDAFPGAYSGLNRGKTRLYDARFHPAEGSSLGTMMGLLVVVVAVVLLIACANLAILMLARGSIRSHGFAVRLALGAARGRIMREALTESLLLAVLGGAIGIAIAYFTAGVIARLLPTESAPSVVPDTTVLVFGCGLAMCTALLFGLVPATQAARVSVTRTLKGQMGGSGRSRVRSTLVVAQVALAVSLASAAALTARSFAMAASVPLGYAVNDRILVTTNLWDQGYAEAEVQAFVREVLERLRGLPEVRSASVELDYPFLGATWRQPFQRPGGRWDGPVPMISTNPVGTDFFRTMEIELLAGRAFDETDVRWGPPVRVVSETTAKNLWPEQDPIGQRVTSPTGRHLWEVVGVVEDVRTTDLGSVPDLYVYSPYAQTPFPSTTRPTFVVHGDVEVGRLRNALLGVDPRIAISKVQSVRDALGREIGPYRTAALFVGLFGALALGLAMVGLYGVLSYSVVCARQEIGIRMALGASARRVGRSVTAMAARLTVLGLLAGGFVLWLGAPLLASFLYGVGPRDAGTWLSAVIVVSAVAATASTLPALRAARVDPMVALRSD